MKKYSKRKASNQLEEKSKAFNPSLTIRNLKANSQDPAGKVLKIIDKLMGRRDKRVMRALHVFTWLIKKLCESF